MSNSTLMSLELNVKIMKKHIILSGPSPYWLVPFSSHKCHVPSCNGWSNIYVNKLYLIHLSCHFFP